TVRYLVEDAARPRVVAAGESLRLKVIALNTGEAVWLMKARGKKGDVALAWRWLDPSGRPRSDTTTPAAIRYDVYPGHRYEFDEWPGAPVEPGRYVLELFLVSGGVGAFPVEPPATIAVTVEPTPTGAGRP